MLLFVLTLFFLRYKIYKYTFDKINEILEDKYFIMVICITLTTVSLHILASKFLRSSTRVL